MTSTAARTAAFPEALAPVADRVEQRIDALLTAEIDRWNAVDPALVDPFRALQEFVTAGGKRLQPAFCACAYVGAGGAIDDPDVALRRTILTALATLGPRQRAVVVLRHWHDLDVDHTARILGISPGTVKSQNARALAHLRDALGAVDRDAVRGRG